MSDARAQDALPSRIHLPSLFACLTALLVCVSPGVLNDGDTYTHVAAGAWMLGHRSVLTTDPFSSTFGGHPWDAHEWLSEVLLATAYRVAGPTGLVLLTATAMAVAFANLARHVARWAGWIETVLLTAAALACVMPGILARPHLLALPLLEAWVAELLLARHARRPPSWWLLPVMTAWANMHGGFAFGLAVALPFAVEATLFHLNRRDGTAWPWWVFLAGATGAALLTPQGVDGLLFPFRLLGLHDLAAIKEWQPMDLSTNPGFEAVLLGLIALLGLGRVRLPAIRLVLLITLLWLSLAHARHDVLFGIVGALILAEPIGRVFTESIPAASRPAGRVLCWSGLLLTVVVRLADPVGTIDGRAAPVSALAHLPAGIARMPVLNSYQFGGYLALIGLHPFIDGRAELFGDDYISNFLAMSGPDGGPLARGIQRYGIGWALLAVEDPLVTRFDALPGWRRQYSDTVAIIFVRA